ncbi:hypothetical protein LTR05_006187 [Lithohypha guttulata]|uniref:Large ribosomal subunit protein mL46 n=1 Tax=Lithohypha guttulata TaxID=1690604 RepID=A0AAN7Y5J2_9EURO|nr:hypothetical protein LTR05_006187 [Lithohypha guttulata]
MCGSCRRHIAQARYASTATAQATIESPPISQVSPDEPAPSSLQQPRIVVKAGVVVSRPPLITPDPHPFETAFYLYQRRLNERLVLPFTQYFHYKRGTPAFEHWRTRRRERGGVAARDLGKYNAYAKDNWNDEALVGDKSADQQHIVEQLLDEEGRQSEFLGDNANESDTKLAGLKRATDADRENDQKSLERNLSRTLYLLVRTKDKSQAEDMTRAWTFPSGDVDGKEGLKEAAQRVLATACGVNMNTWFVANHPIGHYSERPNVENKSESTSATGTSTTSEIDAEKTFFMKARIFSGQADLKENTFELEEFKWLTKEEIEKHVTPGYWQGIKNMLVEH